MADNTELPGTGEVYASDEKGGEVNFQKVLINAFDGPSCDAFGRFRVSEPTTIFDSKLLEADKAPLFWDESPAGGTTSTTPTLDKPYTDIVSTNVTADTFVRQTFRRFNFQPGKGQLILMTGILELASGVTTGCTRRIGIFSDENGAFFESDAGTIGVGHRTSDSGSVVDEVKVQADWNIDTLDGDNDAANPSGVLVDWTLAQVFVIDFQWPIGRIRFGIEIAGVLIYIHQFLHSNVEVIPWASSPNLPLRYEMVTTSSSGICSMRCISATVISEGGTQDIGVVHHSSTIGAGVTTDNENEFFAVVGIRLGLTKHHTTVKIIDAQIQIHTASEFILWVLIWNPTVAGTFTYSAVTNSSVERALGAGATNSVTGGIHIGGGYAETGGGNSGGSSVGRAIETSLILGINIAEDTADQIVLCVMPIGGVSVATVEGSITWREIN